MGALQGILLPARIKKSTPDILRVELGPLPLEMLNARAELPPATLDVFAYPDPVGARRGILSAIAQLLRDPSSSLEQLVRFLNHLLTELP
jgi:hypothetical protein